MATPQLAPTPPACGFHGPDIFIAEGTLRDAIAAAAVTERTNWFGPGGTISTEVANGQFGHLVRYWLAQYASLPPATLVAMQQAAVSPAIAFGQLLNNAANEAALRAAARVVRASLLAPAPVANNPTNINATVEEALLRAVQSRRDTGAYAAWSGVFVVSCIRSVAIQLQLEAMRGNIHEGIDALVRASFRHSDYVIEAYNRRHGSPTRLGTYHAFHPSERVVQRGDVIVQDRRSPLRVNGVTPFPGIPTMGQRWLHCDIVTEVHQGDAETIGGNLSGSVRRRRYPLSVNGQLIILDRHQLYTQENAQRRLPDLPEERDQLTPTSTGRIFALLSPVEYCAAAAPSVGWRSAGGNRIALVSASRGATAGSGNAGRWHRSMEAMENLVQSPFLTEEVLSIDLRDEFESGVEQLATKSAFQRTLTEAEIPARRDVVERQWPRYDNLETSEQELASDFIDRRAEHEENPGDIDEDAWEVDLNSEDYVENCSEDAQALYEGDDEEPDESENYSRDEPGETSFAKETATEEVCPNKPGYDEPEPASRHGDETPLPGRDSLTDGEVPVWRGGAEFFRDAASGRNHVGVQRDDGRVLLATTRNGAVTTLADARMGTLHLDPARPIYRMRVAELTTVPGGSEGALQARLMGPKVIGLTDGTVLLTERAVGNKRIFEDVPSTEQPETLRGQLTHGTRLEIDQGLLRVWMAFRVRGEFEDKSRWVPAKRTFAEVKARRDTFATAAALVPAGTIHSEIEAHLDTLAVVSAIEGGFGSRSGAGDTHASLGIFQWAMKRDQWQETGSLGRFFRDLKARAQ